MRIIETGKTLGKTLKNAGRLRTILAVFARHGLHNILERLQLGRYLLEKFTPSAELDKYSIPQRIRMSFEELGPTYVKLGQLLATRPDLIPPTWVTEFERLHASVQPLSFEVIEQVLKEEFGDSLYNIFDSFESQPLGSASIAQVHQAKLADGTDVVIKVQRPGIVDTINDDLSVLYFLAELLQKYIEETRPFNPVGIVDEYFKTLELETNFLIEANNIRRFAENFKNDESIVIPKVYLEWSTERVLILEALKGTPLSSSEKVIDQLEIDREAIVKTGLRCYMEMVFHYGFFHGDLHAGNFFILPENKIGLIDFGVVGRLNRKTQTAIANMLLALATEDYDRLAEEYINLAPFNEKIDQDQFARELRDVIAPYYGLTLKSVNLGRVLMNSSSVATRNHISLPTELMMFFKSIVTIEGLSRRIIKDFDFLQYALEFAMQLAKTQYDPEKLTQEVFEVLRDSKNLFYVLPRQLRQALRKINHPSFALKIDLIGIKTLPRAIDRFGIMLYWALIVSSLIISATIMLGQPSTSFILSVPTSSFIGYTLAVVFGAWAYWKKR